VECPVTVIFQVLTLPQLWVKFAVPQKEERLNDIKMDLEEVGYKGVDWIHLTQNKSVVGSCEHGNEPSGLIKKRRIF
jgi:hypothetical protein